MKGERRWTQGGIGKYARLAGAPAGRNYLGDPCWGPPWISGRRQNREIGQSKSIRLASLFCSPADQRARAGWPTRKPHASASRSQATRGPPKTSSSSSPSTPAWWSGLTAPGEPCCLTTSGRHRKSIRPTLLASASLGVLGARARAQSRILIRVSALRRIFVTHRTSFPAHTSHISARRFAKTLRGVTLRITKCACSSKVRFRKAAKAASSTCLISHSTEQIAAPVCRDAQGGRPRCERMQADFEESNM